MTKTLWFCPLLLAAVLGCGDGAEPGSDSTSAGGDGNGQQGGGATSDGGAATGGSSSGGGMSTGGGVSKGGSSAGNTSSGGFAEGGSSDGGSSEGGSSGSGSASTGGAGGLGDTGGAPSSGGSSSSTEEPAAHVRAVAVSGTDMDYTFDVSVESDDIDCSQYADWWEVLSEDGMLLYRRILTHSHTDENGTTDPGAPGNTFTRDGGPVEVAADTVVIVRAHMNTGGYHGEVMRGTPAGSFEVATDLADDFAVDVETEPPQPDECAF